MPEIRVMTDYKLTVIGGGIGGYVAAIRAAQLGAKVCLIEKEKLGGTCLNLGCIPTKVLLHTAEIYEELKHADDLGIVLNEQPSVDWKKLQKRKTKIIQRLVKGVEGLLKSNKIKIIKGDASFVDYNTVNVKFLDGKERKLTSEYFIVATGSEPLIPPIKGAGLEGVLDSSKALSLDKLPEKIVIVGGGVIGIEFANIFSAFDTKVTIIEMLPKIGQSMDSDLAEMLSQNMRKSGVDIYTTAKVLSIKKNGEMLSVKYELNGIKKEETCNNVLISTGRNPVTKGLNLEGIQLQTNRGFIVTDDYFKTNIDNIYAVGDVIGRNMLAHVAEEQGYVAADNILLNSKKKVNYAAVPGCLYTKPEIAFVGLSEDEAKKQKINYKTGVFPLANNGKTLITGDTENTFIKVVVDKKYDEIIGISIYGPRATEMISEFTLAINLEATVTEILDTIHPHPTVSEGLKEAVMAVKKQSIHAVNI